jgi:7,8-dihydro-6-hydroxymethylpterin-pyrophosphokinase
MGGTKPIRKGPRLIDIDILLYGNQTIATPELAVPHPRMTERRFVLVPLAELAPELRHPAWRGNVRDLLGHTQDQSQVRKKNASPPPLPSLS